MKQLLKVLKTVRVKGASKNVYACFYDLKKAYDAVNRPLLFYNLLVENKIVIVLLGEGLWMK